MTEKITIAELFAGVGGFRVGFERASEVFQTIWSNQFEPSTKKQHASEIYVKNFGTEGHINADITTVKTEDIPDIDMLVGGFPCFVKGTKVMTDNGYKEIDNINKGDKVLTHNNTFKKVITPMSQEVDKIINLKFYGTPLIQCTENHPFYCIERKINYKNRKKIYSYEIPNEEFKIKAKDLEVNKHYVGINVNTKSDDFSFCVGDMSEEAQSDFDRRKKQNFKNTREISLPLNKNIFWWFVGRYLADGGYSKNKSTKYQVYIVGNKLEEVELENKFNELGIEYIKTMQRTVVRFNFNNILLTEFIKMFGEYSYNKSIPLKVQNLPIEKLTHLIEGYRSGDGHIDKSANELHRITTVSETMAYSFQNIIHKVYKLPCRISKSYRPKTHIIEGREVNQRDTYSIHYRLKPNRNNIPFINGKLWFPLKKKELNIIPTKVYNIEVEEDHTYTVNNLIAFNCQDYSIACSSNNAKGIVGKKGVLWWDIHRIISEKDKKAPKYLLFENVDRLLISPSSQRGRDFAIILSSLNNLGYAVEWKVINAAEYGMPQRRRRTFIFASKKDTNPYNILKNNEPIKIISNIGLFPKTFPINNILSEDIVQGTLSSDLVEITNEFNTLTPKKNAFLDAGYMINGEYYTVKTTPQYSGDYSVLGDFLVDEKDVSDEFYIDSESLKKWTYMKGSKSFPRTSKTGHTYTYSEGAMGFPDSLEKPSRTIITGEGGPGASRFKHVIKVGDKHRRLVPIELERLTMFPDNHTEGVTDSKRAFLMGNALVCGVVTQFANTLLKEI